MGRGLELSEILTSKSKSYGYGLLCKKVCVCAGGWGGVLNVMFKRVKKKNTTPNHNNGARTAKGHCSFKATTPYKEKRKPPHEKN